MSRINIISQVQYDIESIYRCYVASKQGITTIFYIIMIRIKLIIITDRYSVSCHVKVLHADNY